MSKLKRKVTVDADERRKPSVFERLGPGAVRRSYENYDDSDSDRDSSPKKCVHWLRDGSCAYGNACKFQHGPFSGSKGKGRHEADSPEDLRLRVKRKDKLTEKPGSDSDASEAARLRELDYKKELELEQQRQMIQRQLKELDSQEAVHVRGHENFTIEKKIMSRVSSSDSDSDRSRTRGHPKKAKKKKKKKISPNKRSPSPDSDDHHKKHKKKAKGSGKKKRRESLEEIPLKLPEPEQKGRKLLSPLKFKKSHKPVMSQKISAFHSDEEEEASQPPPKRQLQRSFSSSSDDLPRSQLSQKSKEKRSLTPVKKKKVERKPSPEFVKEKRKHSKGRERSLSKSRERSRSSSVEDKKVKKVEKIEKKKIKKEEYYERRKDVDFSQRPDIIERSEKARDHTPMSDFHDFSPEPEVVKKKKDKKKEKKKKDRSLSIELERKHKKDKIKDRDRSVSPSSSRYSQKLDKRALERSLERGSRRELDPRVSSPRGKGYVERRGKSPELAYRGDERSPAARYKDEGRKERDPRDIRDPRELRDPRDLSREGREPREGRELREGRDLREREMRDSRDPRDGRDPRDMSRGREGDRIEYERDRERERDRDFEYERRGREGREAHPSDSRGRPPGPPGSYRDQPPGREYERGPEGPPREPGQERYPPEFRDERRGERYGDQRDPHYQRPPPGYEDRPGYGRDRPPPGERGPYGRPDRPDRDPMDRRDPGDRYDRERFHGDPRGRGDPRFEGPGMGPRPPYRDPGWDRGRGRPPRPWGRGGPPDRRYDDRSRRGDYEGRRDEFYVPERRDWPNRREEEKRPEEKDKQEDIKDEKVDSRDDREKDKKTEGDEKDGKKEEKEKNEEDKEKKESTEENAERDRSRKRRVSGETPSQSPKRTKEGSPALSTHSRKSARSVRNIDKEEMDRLSDRGSDRSRHTARSRGRDDKARSVDSEERKEGDRKRSRSRERKRSRSRSRDGSASGESKRRKTDDKDGKPDEVSEKTSEDKKEESAAVLDNIEQDFSDWSDNDSDDDILNQPELTPPPVPFEHVTSPSRQSEGSQQSKPRDKLEDSGQSHKELVPGVPEQDVDDFESISSEESSLMGVVKTAAVNALEIDWASLNRDDRPKPTTGSALQRFKPGNLFAKIGLSRQYAGEELYNEVVSVCQRQEETEAGDADYSRCEGEEKESKKETEKEMDKQTEEKASEKTEKFEFKHDIAMFHSSAVQKLKERRNLLSDIGPYRRALCARRDLEIRRQLCKVDKVLDHTQVYPSQDVDNELCKLSIQLFRQAKSCTEKQTNNTDTTVVSKEVTCA